LFYFGLVKYTRNEKTVKQKREIRETVKLKSQKAKPKNKRNYFSHFRKYSLLIYLSAQIKRFLYRVYGILLNRF